MITPSPVGTNRTPSSAAFPSDTAGVVGAETPKMLQGHFAVNERDTTAPMLALSSMARTWTETAPTPFWT